MNRLIAYAVALLAVTIPAVLLARSLVETEQDQLERIVSDIEQHGSDALLDQAAFDQGGLVISTGSTSHRFDSSGLEEARAVLDAATGLESAEHVRVRQHDVNVNDSRATAVLNIEVDEGSYVALRVSLTRHEDAWLVEHIRVMG